MLEKLTRSLIEDVAPMLPASLRLSDEDAIQPFERVWAGPIARIRGDTWKLSAAVIKELPAKRYPTLLMLRDRQRPRRRLREDRCMQGIDVGGRFLGRAAGGERAVGPTPEANDGRSSTVTTASSAGKPSQSTMRA